VFIIKRALKIIGWILFFPLVFFVVFALPIDDDIAAGIAVGLWITIPLAAFLISVWYETKQQNKKTEENAIALSKTIISENVGVRSYIDKKTGAVYLPLIILKLVLV